MTSAALLADINVPSPVDIVADAVATPAGWAWDRVAEGLARWVLGGVGYFVDGVVQFLLNSARPDVRAAWFSGAGSPYATVRGVAITLLLAFVFLGIVQSLIAGDTGGMIRRVTADLPAAVFGMVTTTVVVGTLLELTDALSTTVLGSADSQSLHFLSGFGVAVTGATQGFAAVLLGLVAVIAGFVVWVELMVRSVLVYILVALSPLSFAAMVWPSARGVLRRTIELLLAVILSKLVICVAISVGVAALSSAGASAAPGAPAADQGAASMGTLFVGTAVLAMAAFAPFLVLKLIPWAESALVAQGVSRSPIRGTEATMSNVYHAQTLTRLAGGGTRAGAALPAPTSGWTVGAPALGTSAAGGATAIGAAAGPVAIAPAGARAAGSHATTSAVRSVEATTDTPPHTTNSRPSPGTQRGKDPEAKPKDRP